MKIGSWYYREKGAGNWVMHMGIRLHRVAILFLVILFMGGFFLGGLSLRVFALHTNFFSCMESLVDCLSAGYGTTVCIYPFFLFCLGYCVSATSHRLGNRSKNRVFFICLLYGSCLYVCMYGGT